MNLVATSTANGSMLFLLEEIMEGWIKLHRKLLNWEWYTEPNTFRLFVHLLLKANHKERNYRGNTIECGQVMTGQDLLSSELGLTRQQIRTAISNLKSTNEITVKSSRLGSVFQIVNYQNYQVATNETTIKQPRKQPSINQASTSNKNVKKDKERKKLLGERFENWFKYYGVDTSKESSKKLFVKLTDEQLQQITLHTPKYVKVTDIRFRKNPYKYLSQKTYMDEVIDRRDNKEVKLRPKF